MSHAVAGAIRLTPTVGNVVFYVISTASNLLQIKGFGRLESEDAKRDIQNIIEISQPFNVTSLNQESI